MHTHDVGLWRHEHAYGDPAVTQANERRTIYVVLLTAVTMVLEIWAGMAFNSMALLADGWHMASHAGALGIAVLAYRIARYHRHNPRFTFGVGKVESLGGYTSAVALGIAALIMAWESVHRLIDPVEIAFNQAMLVAMLGLVVNLWSAWLLRDGHAHHHHGHSHDPGQGHAQHHHPPAQDQNLRGAYLHVLADALTSVLAIAALFCGLWFGWVRMDAVVGLVGALVIARWSYGLLRQAGEVLLDYGQEAETAAAVRQIIEEGSTDRVIDLHIWRVGARHYSAIISLVTDAPLAPDHYKQRLRRLSRLSHITVEVNPCHPETCRNEDLHL
ncbi:MAG: CDF family Co(II)/Ni(II) efflux transporter DmeF [Magnetospiraceae bacterium]